MSKKTQILIAEDEKPMAKALQAKLQHEGFEVSLAFDGAEALQKLDEGSFDLLILDLIMPNVDGFAVLEALRKKDQHVQVIVATNLSQQVDIDRVKKLGAVDYFVKSDTPLVEVVDHIKKVLG